MLHARIWQNRINIRTSELLMRLRSSILTEGSHANRTLQHTWNNDSNKCDRNLKTGRCHGFGFGYLFPVLAPNTTFDLAFIAFPAFRDYSHYYIFGLPASLLYTHFHGVTFKSLHCISSTVSVCTGSSSSCCSGCTSVTAAALTPRCRAKHELLGVGPPFSMSSTLPVATQRETQDDNRDALSV